MGGGSGAVIRRAGRFGTSLLLASAGPAEVAERRALWEESMRPHPRQEPRVAVTHDVWVERDESRLAWIRGRWEEMWRFYARFDDAQVKISHVPGEVATDDIEANVASMMAYVTLGGPEAVYEELAAIVRAGADELVLRVRFDGIEAEVVDRQLRVLAEEVVPELRKL
jgi:alkanesulfonate monooxygenase SsuD/methylene tetrahydromethanopterin reductase-like flavin-dependent oxidoreductase (luciferase family)